jgi:hypothetical protein
MNATTCLQNAIHNAMTDITDPLLWVEYVTVNENANPMELAQFLRKINNKGDEGEEGDEDEKQNKIWDDEKELMVELESISNFFENNPMIFEEMKDENPVDQFKLIVGHVQSGKSDVICGLAVYNILVQKRTTLVIVRNFTGDYQQLASKFQKTEEKFTMFGIDILYGGDKNEMALSDAISGRTAKLIIIIANNTHGRTLNRVLQARKQCKDSIKFDVVIDECDDLAYKKNADAKWISELDDLLPFARQIFGITATAFDVMFMENKLQTDGIYRLKRPENYKGIDHIITKHMDTTTFIKKNGRRELSEAMVQLYDDISDVQFNESYEDDGQLYNHPNIVLHKTCTFTKDHELFLSEFRRIRILADWVKIIYNGQGCILHHTSLENGYEGEPIVIDGVEGTCVRGEWTFIKVSVGSVLEWIRNYNPNAYITSNIVIMSGILSGRGINFVSSPSYKWHLTHQILATSVTRSVSDLIQSIRLFGRYNDDIPLTLYTPQNHINDLRKGIALHEQFIDGALNAEESEKMIEFYKKTPVFSDLVPKIKLSTKTKYQLNSVVRMVGEESDKEWGLKNLRKNLENAIKAKRSTVIVKILRFLKFSCPESTCTKNEILTTCEAVNFKPYIVWEKKHSYYKLLVESEGGLYKLNPEVEDVVQDLIMKLDY